MPKVPRVPKVPVAGALALAIAFSAWVLPHGARAQAAAQQAIVNGRLATEADVRGTVGILDAPSGQVFCTGTLVDATTVITAAHCIQTEELGGLVEASSLRVLGGVLDLESDPAGNLPASVAVARIAGNCDYFDTWGNLGIGPNDESGFGRGDDIAVLVLAAPYAAVTPTPPLPPRRAAELTVGQEVAMVGYGVYQLEPERSGTLYAATTTLEQVTGYELLTARDATGSGMDSCFGDSGGPLYWTDASNETFLVGVVSRGTADSRFDCGDGGIYTRPEAYEGFVRAVREDVAPTCRFSPPPDDVLLRSTLRGGAGCAVHAPSAHTREWSGGAALPMLSCLALWACAHAARARRRRRRARVSPRPVP
ncbi:MAG: trypsin-like serine protease [Myxococcales bacterium]|nr:trypsin-like serine protease [Myxococcales bacterium]